MALFNYATKEITLKVVYYGPGLSGKTTNLQFLHSVLNPETKGKLLSLSTEADRTLFFDFLPIELGKIRDFSIRFQLYTVPGQVRYNATRKVVLKGADAIVFVADSQREMREQNIESFSNMLENLSANNINPGEIAIVLQYNKRDLRNILSVEELDRELNSYNYPITEATAVSGAGVEDTFKLVTKLLLKYISKKHKIEIQSTEREEEPEEVEPSAPEAPAYAEAGIPEAIPFEAEEIPAEEVAPEYADSFELVGNETTPVTMAPSAEPEPRAIKSVPPFAETLAETPAEPSLLPPPVYPAVPAPDRAIDDIREAVGRLEKKIDRISEGISLMHAAVVELQQEVRKTSEDRRTPGEKELRDIRQGQTEVLGFLKDVISTLKGLREKKSWFRF